MSGRSAQEAVLCLLIVHLSTAVVEQFVRECPQTKDDWERESLALQCQEPTYYHCMRTDNGQFTQFCTKKFWIQNEMCPEYNSKARRMDVFECRMNHINCPKATFWSNTVYLYPECYRSSTSTTITTLVYDTSKNKPSSSTINDNEPVVTLILSTLLPTLFTCVTIGIVLYLCVRRRRQRGETNEREISTIDHSSMLEYQTDETSSSGFHGEQIRLLGKINPKEENCQVYIVEGPPKEGLLLSEQQRILVLVLLNPHSPVEQGRIEEEAKLAFELKYAHCKTLSYVLKHKQEQVESVHLKSLEGLTSDVQTILRKLRDVASSVQNGVKFVVTVPLCTWSPNREAILSISKYDPTLKVTYI